MNDRDLVVGKIYWIRGGHVMRYCGKFVPHKGVSTIPSGEGLGRCFRGVREPYKPGPQGGGYSASAGDVLFEETGETPDALRQRWHDAAARKMTEIALDAAYLIQLALDRRPLVSKMTLELVVSELDERYELDVVDRENVLGFLRRVPGSHHHRAPPNGIEDPPAERELRTALGALRLDDRVRRKKASASPSGEG